MEIIILIVFLLWLGWMLEAKRTGDAGITDWFYEKFLRGK